MNKREVLKGVGIGVAALGAVAIPAVASEAYDMDWRDELLSNETHWRVFSKGEYENGSHYTVDNNWHIDYTIYVFLRSAHEKKYLVDHSVYKWIKGEGNLYNSKELHKEEASFPTLKEAYLYAKQLKEKHYG
jgi:hypothetical protein